MRLATTASAPDFRKPLRFRECVTVLLAVIALAQPRSMQAAEKRVEIDKTRQVLRAYEDGNLFLETRVSTGRPGRETPSGVFSAGAKYRMHYSRLYDNAPMPYSVQISGNYFIHGYHDVPNWPASHGCIRVPLSGANPAARFYAWVEAGTLITIHGKWQRPPARQRRAEPTSLGRALSRKN